MSNFVANPGVNFKNKQAAVVAKKEFSQEEREMRMAQRGSALYKSLQADYPKNFRELFPIEDWFVDGRISFRFQQHKTIYSPKELDFFKKKLNTDLEKVEKELEQIVAIYGEMCENENRSGDSDIGEGSFKEKEADRDRLEARIKEIQDALKRIEMNIYGKDEKTKRLIHPYRLFLSSVATERLAK